ncbi:exonuclease SbcC [Serratia marcescens]|uniref:exonuclease SbcC n=5 Tax=Serratia marcescens TaxID=615 RepID=UPI001F14F1C9|nr:exonuclease SbcC [Serratia marcescens]
MNTNLRILRLIIVGIRKNYVTTFHNGLNIIYGDSDTGKSTILELINYTLGSKNIDLADEINSSALYVSAEYIINGSPYTFKRDIFNKNNPIEVYPCKFEDCSNFYPDKFNPTSAINNNGLDYISDFILELLSYPKLKIKTSPSKANSDFQKVSFRNIFKFCYLDQDSVGSKNLLENSNWIKSTIIKETFKYITNTLDSSISELSVEISNIIKNKDNLLKEHAIISKFLHDSNVKNINEIDNEISFIDESIDELSIEIEKINVSMTANSENYQELKSIFKEETLITKRIDLEINELATKIENYSRLLNDYDNDIDKISSVIMSQSRMGQDNIESSPCPICDNLITIDISKSNFSLIPSEHLSKEIHSLQSRKKDIQSLIKQSQSEHKIKINDFMEQEATLDKIRSMIDEENDNMVTPFLTQRDALLKELNLSEEKRKSLVSSLKLRNQLSKVIEKIAQYEASLVTLEANLVELKKNTPDINTIFTEMSNYLQLYLKGINIKNRKDISISNKTFLPIVRSRDYSSITSGGLRTIISIGYYLSIISLGLNKKLNYPNFIMIDTVGKYLGKIDSNNSENFIDDELDDGITDPEKYKNIYLEMIKICESAIEDDVSCQIIIVDNDIPSEIKELENVFVVEHFSTTGAENSKIGLIDDI